MEEKVPKVKVSRYIDKFLKQEAQKLAESRGRTLSNLIAQILKQEVAMAKASREID